MKLYKRSALSLSLAMALLAFNISASAHSGHTVTPYYSNSQVQTGREKAPESVSAPQDAFNITNYERIPNTAIASADPTGVQYHKAGVDYGDGLAVEGTGVDYGLTVEDKSIQYYRRNYQPNQDDNFDFTTHVLRGSGGSKQVNSLHQLKT